MALDGFGYQWRHFLEYFTTLLDKQFIRFTNTGFVRPVQEAEIIPDIIGKGRFQASAKNLEAMPGLGIFFPLNQNRRAGITKNEMAVPLTEIKVARTDFRAYNQHRPS